jgi:hypothetical protein
VQRSLARGSHPRPRRARPITMTTSRRYWTVAAIAAAITLTGCGAASAPPSSQPGTTAPATTPQPTAPATPDTAAAARSAAQSMFALYAAGQYAAVYPLLDAQVRGAVPAHKWITVHEDCPRASAGLSYKVGEPVMAGQTAVMSVSLSGAAAAIGSDEESFVYQDGGWFWAPSASDMSAAGNYKGTVARIVARLKASGYCS